jgi:hypothetical protein
VTAKSKSSWMTSCSPESSPDFQGSALHLNPCLLRAGFFIILLIGPEDGDTLFLQNFGQLLQDHKMSYLRVHQTFRGVHCAQTSCFLRVSLLSYSLILKMETIVPSKFWPTSAGPQDVISQKMLLGISPL